VLFPSCFTLSQLNAFCCSGSETGQEQEQRKEQHHSTRKDAGPSHVSGDGCPTKKPCEGQERLSKRRSYKRKTPEQVAALEEAFASAPLLSPNAASNTLRSPLRLNCITSRDCFARCRVQTPSCHVRVALHLDSTH
jgi:hypothetical protein